MAKARVQSDIDTDFEYLRKDDVIAAEANDYGYDCFAKIETFGTMHADISRHRFHANSYSPAVLIVNPACLYANMI